MVVDLSLIQGNIIFVIDGIETKCSIEKVVGGGYRVTSLCARDNTVVVSLEKNEVILNDLRADWVKKHIVEFGSEPNIFD